MCAAFFFGVLSDKRKQDLGCLLFTRLSDKDLCVEHACQEYSMYVNTMVYTLRSTATPLFKLRLFILFLRLQNLYFSYKFENYFSYFGIWCSQAYFSFCKQRTFSNLENKPKTMLIVLEPFFKVKTSVPEEWMEYVVLAKSDQFV